MRVAGQVLYNARNNWVSDSWKRGVDPLPWNRSQHRLVTRSTDGGDTWDPVSYDGTLSDHSHGCQGSLLAHPPLSDTVFFSQPLTPSVRAATPPGRPFPPLSVVVAGSGTR